MGDVLLSVENLHVSFSTENGVAEVLDGVNLSIQTGEIVGLVGESGCGKTTLARSILGILPKNSAKISDGSIVFDHQNLLDMQEQDVARDIRGRLITFIPYLVQLGCTRLPYFRMHHHLVEYHFLHFLL